MPDRFGKMEGIILAGGQSRRMGQDKANLRILGEETLLAFQIRHFGAVLGCRPWIARPFGFEPGPWDLSDSKPNRGPLEGIRSGLRQALGDYVAVLAVDLPNAGCDALWRLLTQELPSEPKLAVVPMAEGRMQPLAGLWPRCWAADLSRFLAAGFRRVGEYLEGKPVRMVEVPNSDWLENLNTPQSLQKWRQAHG